MKYQFCYTTKISLKGIFSTTNIGRTICDYGKNVQPRIRVRCSDKCDVHGYR
jgi:hypothetical protein